MPVGALSSLIPPTPWGKLARDAPLPATSGFDSSVPGLEPVWADGESSLPLNSPGPGSFSSLLTNAELDSAFDLGLSSHDPSTSQAGACHTPPHPLPPAASPAWPSFTSLPVTCNKPDMPSVLAAGPSPVFPSPLSSPAASNASGPLLSPPQQAGPWDVARLTDPEPRSLAVDQPTWRTPGLAWNTSQAGASAQAHMASPMHNHEQPFVSGSSETGYPQLHAAMGLQETTPEPASELKTAQEGSPPKPSAGKPSSSITKGRSKGALPKNYACNLCGAAFARNHDLRRHARIHMANKPYSCPTCHKQFSRKDAMSRHLSVKSGCLRARRDHTAPMRPSELGHSHHQTSVFGEYKAYNVARRPSTAPGTSELPDWPQAETVPPYTSMPGTAFSHTHATGDGLLNSAYALFDASTSTRSRAATVGSVPTAPVPGLWTSDVPRSAPLEEPMFLFSGPPS